MKENFIQKYISDFSEQLNGMGSYYNLFAQKIGSSEPIIKSSKTLLTQQKIYATAPYRFDVSINMEPYFIFEHTFRNKEAVIEDEFIEFNKWLERSYIPSRKLELKQNNVNTMFDEYGNIVPASPDRYIAKDFHKASYDLQNYIDLRIYETDPQLFLIQNNGFLEDTGRNAMLDRELLIHKMGENIVDHDKIAALTAPEPGISIFYYIFACLLLIVTVLLSVAFFTLAERNFMGAIQRRKGPDVVGLFGSLQPIADGLKLLMKEPILVQNANPYLFAMAPLISFSLALLSWIVIPFDYGVVIADLDVGLLFLFVTSSLGVFGLIIGGWASNSKYPFLGALRSAAQLISYELSLGFIFVSVVLCAESLNLTEIVLIQEDCWLWKPLSPLVVFYVILMLAETGRHPFDLPEAEPEIVAGYNTEYSGMLFALFYLGEYSNMLLMSSLGAICFFGGWLPPFNVVPFTLLPGSFWFILKTLFFVILFIKARADLPRFRYDQMMHFGWKISLPFTFGYAVLTANVLYVLKHYDTEIEKGLDYFFG